MNLPTRGRIVLYRVQQPNQYDDGYRPAIVCGRDKKGLSLGVFADCAHDPAQPPGLGTLMYVRSVPYGDGNREWRWPRDEDNIFNEPAAMEPDSDPEPSEQEDGEESHGESSD